MKRILFIVYTILLCSLAHSQTKIGDRQGGVTPSAKLELSATDKGMSLPNVSLIDIYDILTIPNPLAGMQIFNLVNSGVDDKKVFKDQVYVFNGTTWELFMDKSALSALGIPTLYGTAKTTSSLSLLNRIQLGPNYSQRDAVVMANGSIKPKKKGYYQYICKMELRLTLIAGHGYSPFFRTPGSGISFLISAPWGVSQIHTISHSGIVYLSGTNVATNTEEASSNVVFVFGNNKSGKVGDEIVSSEILWLYLGDL